MTPAGREGADVRALLGMSTFVARLVVVPVYAGTYLMHVLETRGAAGVWVLSWFALAVLTAAGGIIMFAEGDPLPRWATAAVFLSGPTAMALILVRLPGPLIDHTVIWPVPAAVIVYTYTCVRGRTVTAWLGITSVVGVVCVWAGTFGSPLYGFGITVWSYTPLIISTFFALTIRPAAATIFALRERSNDELVREAAAQAALEERDIQLRRLDELVRPLLGRIAEAAGAVASVRDRAVDSGDHGTVEQTPGGGLTPDERDVCALLEAHLRDTLRARVLVDDEVSAAVRSARSAGAEVVLLDDGGGAQRGEPLRAALLPHLAAANGGKVTARVLPAGRAVAMTVLVTTSAADSDDAMVSDETVRYEYDGNGALVELRGSG